MTEPTNSSKVKDKRLNKAKVDAKNKTVALEALYVYYPHKTVNPKPGTVPVPYVPKKEISTHEYKLTYQEWRAVLACYFKHLIRYLMQGYTYKVPYGLGTFIIKKQRIAKRDPVALKKNPVPGYRKTYQYPVDGYKIFLYWEKGKSRIQSTFLRYYNVRLMREILFGIYKACAADRGLLYRFRNSKYDE